MKQYLLGIDVGTTGTKTLLFSAKGELLGYAYRPYELHTPQVGYSEQNAEDWWNAVCDTVREVCADPKIARSVVAISLSLQGGTMVAVDQEGNPVRPAIVWNDGRGEAQGDIHKILRLGSAKLGSCGKIGVVGVLEELVLEFHRINSSKESGVTAMVGPVGVYHTDFGDSGASAFLFKVFLAEGDIVDIHSKSE